MPSDDSSPWQLEQSGRQIHTSRLPTGRGGKSETKAKCPVAMAAVASRSRQDAKTPPNSHQHGPSGER
ncbi:hypothetical protein GQ607_013836 [Colletotrichum asianum]|uniref:Uncharacterized protein n=1 Tax=Colletotrichum asianum TaxID=702518 RepID=A0A8H3ZKB4_9PEZI|nr:hypothetical protein GQ607_013836 [Colletotrichum asianum]